MRKYTKEDFVRAAEAKHGDKFSYEKVDFINMQTPVVVGCPIHGDISVSPHQHIHTETGCSKCGESLRISRSVSRLVEDKTWTTDDYVAVCKSIHGDRYDYRKTVYTGYGKKVTIICKEHGEFTKHASAHIGKQRQGCPICSKPKTEDFIIAAKAIHGDRYDYSKVDVNAKIDGRLPIGCPVHGIVMVSKRVHLGGVGCPLCGKSQRIAKVRQHNTKRTKTTAEFVNDANRIHNGLYDYSKTEYIGIGDEVTIICKTHGEFKQISKYHLSGCGCQKCSMSSKSKLSQQWLDEMGVPDECREIPISIDGKTIIVDGFDSTTNTIYEFWGDFWHGNPSVYDKDGVNARNGETFGELFRKTKEKIDLISAAGYNLIDVWECDYVRSSNYDSI